MMGVGEGGFLRTLFCEVVEITVEVIHFRTFGFQLDGEMMNAKLCGEETLNRLKKLVFIGDDFCIDEDVAGEHDDSGFD